MQFPPPKGETPPSNPHAVGSGGLEMLFSDQRRHPLSLPAVTRDGQPATLAFLIDYLCRNTMKDGRKELFVLDGHL